MLPEGGNGMNIEPTISESSIGLPEYHLKDPKVVKELLIARSTLNLAKEDQFLSSEDKESKKVTGQAHYRLAKIYYDKADIVKAEEFFLKALDQCELPQDAFAIMKIAGFLIRIYSESLKKEEAQNFIDISKTVLEVIVSRHEILKAEYFFHLATTNMYVGNFEESMKNFQLAYKRAQEENEPELVAKSLYSLARSSYNEKDYKQALKLLNQLDQLLAILNKGYLKGSVNLLYGQIYNQMGEYNIAIDYLKKSLKDLNAKMCWNLLGYTLLHLGIAYKKNGDYKTSLIYFDLSTSVTNPQLFKRLNEKVLSEVNDVNDTNVDFYIDRQNRLIHVKELGTIDFKHRFVLLEILFLLAKNPGKYFDKEDLASDIWKDDYNPLIHDKLIYTSVSRLRKLVEPQDQKSKYIIRGKDGYTFSPAVNVRFYHGAGDKQLDSIGNVEISSPI